MSANFIISFDCEGKWGAVDLDIDCYRHCYTNTNLINAYRKLTTLLDKYQIKATFAFVTAFTFSVDQYHDVRRDFREVFIHGKAWLHNFYKEILAENYEGWFTPQCYQIIKQAAVHEIASHGFTHLPLDENIISLDDCSYELAMTKKHASHGNDPNQTFVYPRNQIGFVSELDSAGFIGYREALKKTGRLSSFLSELNIFSTAIDLSAPNNALPISIPAGRILNWRCGFRRKIPISLTIKRWEYILDDAIKNQKTAHLWTHPHNFITGDNMYILLESIIKRVAQAQKKG